MDIADFKTASPSLSVHRSISQSQLQTSELSASVLGKLSLEILVPFLPSSSEPKYGSLNHQSPSFAQSGFSPKTGKDRVYYNIRHFLRHTYSTA